MYKHIIITRFNLKFNGLVDFDKNNKKVHTGQWLEERFLLFDKYCFPSLMNQSCKEFTWFVLFDINTPPKFLEKIKNYEMQFPLFRPLFLEKGDNETIKKEINRVIPSLLEYDDQYIISTRIDNDDAFHFDMVREVQNSFIEKNDVFISFTYGLQFDINQQILASLYYENNHFISRIEKLNKTIETVITHDHTYIDKVSDVIYVRNRKMKLWLEIIHDGNLINSLYPTAFPLLTSRLLRNFFCPGNISARSTMLMLANYLKLKILQARANFLKSIGLYDFLKRKLNR